MEGWRDGVSEARGTAFSAQSCSYLLVATIELAKRSYDLAHCITGSFVRWFVRSMELHVSLCIVRSLRGRQRETEAESESERRGGQRQKQKRGFSRFCFTLQSSNLRIRIRRRRRREMNGPGASGDDVVGSQLETLLQQLHGQIRNSGWLEKNTAEKLEEENPQLIKAWKEAIDEPATSQQQQQQQQQ